MSLLSLPHRWQRLKYAFRVALQDPTLYPLDATPPFDLDLCERMFLRNQDVLHRHAESIGARPLTYLQPFNGFGPRALAAVDASNLAHVRRRVSIDGTNEVDAMYAFYRRVIAEVRRRGSRQFFDLTGVFDGRPAQIFIDQAHPSDVGYDLIARRMAADILEREGVARPEAPT